MEYRPKDTCWDDYKSFSIGPMDLWQPYDNHTTRLCFVCLDSYCAKGSIFCIACGYRHTRKAITIAPKVPIITQKTLPSHVHAKAAIYKLTILGCYYIGQARDPAKRRRDHIHMLTVNRHHNKDLQTAWNMCDGKYDWSLIEHYPMTLEQMNAVEEKWIRAYYPNIFNLGLPIDLPEDKRTLPNVKTS
jgi:hypothetical protein